jgi:TP901 family phage tail tape measure protein
VAKSGDTYELKIKVGTEGVKSIDLVDGKVDKLGKSAQKSTGRFGKMRESASRVPLQLKVLAGALTVLIGIFTGSIAAAASFQSQLAVVSTMLDTASLGTKKYNALMQSYSIGMRALSVEMGESTATLSKGLYDILSASIPPAKAMDVLTIATKAAKAGITDTATSVDFITSALNAYGMQAEDAGKVSDIAFATVASGKTTFAELASSIGQVAPEAAASGIQLDQLGAMLATVTKAGISTSESVTAINQLIVAFKRESPKAIQAWKDLSAGTSLAGAAWNKSLIQGNNLSKTLGVLSKATDSQKLALFSEINAMKAANVLIAQQDDYRLNLARTTKAAGQTQAAYDKVTRTLNHQLSRFWQVIKDVAVEIGNHFLPPLTEAVEWMVEWYQANKQLIDQKIDDYVGSVVRWITDLIKSIKSWYDANGDLLEQDIGEFFGEIQATGAKAWEVVSGIAKAIAAVYDGIVAVIEYIENSDVTSQLAIANNTDIANSIGSGIGHDLVVAEVYAAAQAKAQAAIEAQKLIVNAYKDTTVQLTTMAGSTANAQIDAALKSAKAYDDKAKKIVKKEKLVTAATSTELTKQQKAILELHKHENQLAAQAAKERIDAAHSVARFELEQREEGLAKAKAIYNAETIALYNKYSEQMALAGRSEDEMTRKLAAFEQQRERDYWQSLLAQDGRTQEWLRKRVAYIKQNVADERIAQQLITQSYSDFIRERQSLTEDHIYRLHNLLMANLVSGFDVAAHEILSDQQSLQEFLYEGWNLTFNGINDGMSDIVVAGINDGWDGITDAFDNACQSILDSWIRLIADMIAQWATSGILGLFTGQGFSGFSLDNLFGGLSGQISGTATEVAGLSVGLGSLSSTISNLPTVLGAGGLTGAVQLGSTALAEFGATGAAMADAIAGYSGSLAVFNEGVGVAASELGSVAAAGESAAAGISMGALAAAGGAIAFAELLALTGVIETGPIGAVGQILFGSDGGHTPESALQYIIHDFEYLQRATTAYQRQLKNGLFVDGFLNNIRDAAWEMELLADRAGLAQGEIDAMIDALDPIGAAMAEAAQATKHLDNEVERATQRFKLATDEYGHNELAISNLANTMYNLVESMGLTDQRTQTLYAEITRLNTQLRAGQITADQFGEAMQHSISAQLEQAVRAGETTAQQMRALADSFDVAKMTSGQLGQYMAATSAEVVRVSEAVENRMNAAWEAARMQMDDTATAAINLAGSLFAIPTEISSTVKTNFVSTGEISSKIQSYVVPTPSRQQQSSSAKNINVSIKANGPLIESHAADAKQLAKDAQPAILDSIKQGLKEASKNGEIVLFSEGIASFRG